MLFEGLGGIVDTGEAHETQECNAEKTARAHLAEHRAQGARVVRKWARQSGTGKASNRRTRERTRPVTKRWRLSQKAIGGAQSRLDGRKQNW